MPGSATHTRSSSACGCVPRSTLANLPSAIVTRTSFAQPSGNNADLKCSATLFPALEMIGAVDDEILAGLGQLERLDEFVGRNDFVGFPRFPVAAEVLEAHAVEDEIGRHALV